MAGIGPLPVVAGVLFYFAYYPLHWLAPNLVGLIPLLSWIDRREEAGPKVWFRGGLVFGAALSLLILHWMRSMLTISWWAVGAYLGLALLFSVCHGLVVLAVAWLRHRTRWSFALVLPAVWIPMEWVQSLGDLRMTAQHVSHTLSGLPFLIQIADLVGPYGVGAALLAANALIYECARGYFRGRWKAPAAALAVLTAAVLGYGGWRWTHPPEEGSSVRVGIVQPNVPLLEKMDSATDDEQAARLESLTRQAAAEGARLIFWPETARPKALIHEADNPRSYAMPDVARLARETGATLVVGVEYVAWRGAEDHEVYNAAMVVHPDGTVDPAWSAKVYLVPFVEGVPIRPLLGPALEGNRGALRWLSGGFEPGRKGVVLPAGPARVGATICFEELYFDLHRRLRNEGATLQAILTNHAWFERTFFQRYAADTVRFRAIENRSWFVRVSNTGISGFVDPLGRFHDEIGLFEEGVRVREVGLCETRTLYDRIGDAVVVLAGLTLACAATVAVRKERRREREANAVGDDVGAVPGRSSGDHGPGLDSGGDDRGPRRDPSGDGQPDP